MGVVEVRGSRARRSAPMAVAARLGLTARAAIYLLIAVLILLIAMGKSSQEADQRGAMQAVVARPGGGFVVWLLGLGLAGYALWRFAEAAFGVAGEGRRTGPRLQSLCRGLIYAFFAANAFAVLAGSRRSQAAQSQELSARVMRHDGGRYLVGLVGVIVAVVGLVLVAQGLRRSFAKYLRLGGLSEPARRAVIAVGVVGTVARGLVFALAGVLVVDAAVRFDPQKAAGIDATVRTLRDQSYGPALLVATGCGLLAFAAYGLMEARWRVT